MRAAADVVITGITGLKSASEIANFLTESGIHELEGRNGSDGSHNLAGSFPLSRTRMQCALSPLKCGGSCAFDDSIDGG